MGVDTRSAAKKKIKRLPYWSCWFIEDKSFNVKLCFLAEYGQRNSEKYKIIQRLCDYGKGATGKIYPLAKD